MKNSPTNEVPYEGSGFMDSKCTTKPIELAEYYPSVEITTIDIKQCEVSVTRARGAYIG